MTTDARRWNACARCNKLLRHFDEYFQEQCQQHDQSHVMTWENRLRPPWGTQDKLEEEKI